MFSDSVMVNFTESVITAVNGYYGRSRGTAYQKKRDEPYELIYSLVMDSNGQWVSSGGDYHYSYAQYNCYFYAIDKPDLNYYYGGYRDPGFYSGGTDDPSYDPFNETAYNWALQAKADLEHFWCTDVVITGIAPDPLTLGPQQKLICVRLGTWDDYPYITDYHYMKYNAGDGFWYHKPGDSAPLRYLYEPADEACWDDIRNEYVWTNEGNYFGIEEESYITYFGDIYYITYTEEFGSGMENDPYLVATAEQLKKVPEVDRFYKPRYFKMVDNIDLLGETWEPLPSLFGVFDGDGFTVSGFYTDQSITYGENLGLFGVNSYGIIKNLHVRGSIGLSQNNRAGLIAGINYGSIIGCSSGFDGRRDMIFLMKHTTSYAGGITGYNGNEGIVQDCINYGGVHGMDHAGGLVGYNEGMVTGCYNEGTIEGTYNIGGIVGYNDGTVEKSCNLGYVYGSEIIGGVAGYNAGSVEKSYNTGEVFGVFGLPQNVGGVAGYNAGTVEMSYNTGNVGGGDNIGGVAGYNTGTVEKTYNTGNVSGGYNIGGISGINEYGYVVNTYNAGNVSGYHYISGIVGLYNYASGVVANNVSLGSSLSSEIAAARVFCGTGFFSGNKARDDMAVTVAGIPKTNFSNTYGNDGQDVAIGTAMSSVFSNNWDSSIWSIPSGSLTINGALPTLLGMLFGSQHPILP